jgi:hypothetical protein
MFAWMLPSLRDIRLRRFHPAQPPESLSADNNAAFLHQFLGLADEIPVLF